MTDHHRPSGSYHDPVHTRPGVGSTPAQRRSAGALFAIVGAITLVVVAFGIGSPVAGIVVLVLAGLVGFVVWACVSPPKNPKP